MGVGILSWILFGLIAGALAKLVLPGRDPGGIVVTILIGVAGGLLGGFVASALGGGGVTGFNPGSFLVAIAGAIALLFLYRLAVADRRAGA